MRKTNIFASIRPAAVVPPPPPDIVVLEIPRPLAEFLCSICSYDVTIPQVLSEKLHRGFKDAPTTDDYELLISGLHEALFAVLPGGNSFDIDAVRREGGR